MFQSSNWLPPLSVSVSLCLSVSIIRARTHKLDPSKENKLGTMSSDYHGARVHLPSSPSPTPLPLTATPAVIKHTTRGGSYHMKAFSGSRDILRKHSSDDSKPDTHSAELAAKGQVACTGTHKTKKIMNSRERWSINKTWPSGFTHSGKCVAARDRGPDTWLHHRVLHAMRFPLQVAQIFHSSLRCCARDDSCVTSRALCW